VRESKGKEATGNTVTSQGRVATGKERADVFT